MLFNICARVFGQAVNFDWIGLLGKLLILFLHSLYKLLLNSIVKVYSPLGKLKNRMNCFLLRVLTSIMSIDYQWLSTIPQSPSWIKWKINATHCDYKLQKSLPFCLSPLCREKMMKNVAKLWRIATRGMKWNVYKTASQGKVDSPFPEPSIHWLASANHPSEPILMGWFSPTQALWELM